MLVQAVAVDSKLLLWKVYSIRLSENFIKTHFIHVTATALVRGEGVGGALQSRRPRSWALDVLPVIDVRIICEITESLYNLYLVSFNPGIANPTFTCRLSSDSYSNYYASTHTHRHTHLHTHVQQRLHCVSGSSHVSTMPCWANIGASSGG